jgi:hypothetical protein
LVLVELGQQERYIVVVLMELILCLIQSHQLVEELVVLTQPLRYRAVQVVEWQELTLLLEVLVMLEGSRQ